MVKSYGWVAHVILARGPNSSFWGTFIRHSGLLGQGLELGPGLDNNYIFEKIRHK